jgi:OmpA-OmpF porin, OOP family
MKQILFFFFFIVLGLKTEAQNLLPNGDFEEDVICIEYNLKCGPMGWRLTSADPPSYYSEFKKGDTIASAHWTSFVPFSMNNRGKYREYLQTSILCPLEKGRKYTFSMQIKPEEFAVKEIAVLFVSNYIITPENQLITGNPQIKFHNDHFLFDPKGGWITLTSTYVATGAEKYLLIGNFRPNSFADSREIEYKGKEKRQSTYYIDNVILKPITNQKICDFTDYLAIIRNNRWRHTNPSLNFFPTSKPEVPLAFDTLSMAKIKKNQPVILKNIFFDTDKYELLPRSFPELQKLVKLLNDTPGLAIEINGHTDNTGDEQHNRQLSLKRAESVANYLKSNRIEEVRITYKGFASSIPIDTNETPEGRQKNRRVEFLLR